MLRHFGVWPEGVDKENLIYEQKVFITYLSGQIPGMYDWRRNVSYQTEKRKIENLKEAALTQEEIDLATLRGEDIKKIRKKALEDEKQRRLTELDKTFGVIKDTGEGGTGGAAPTKEPEYDPKKLWELLNKKYSTD